MRRAFMLRAGVRGKDAQRSACLANREAEDAATDVWDRQKRRIYSAADPKRGTVEALVSTASCDKSVGWSLPPGPYDVRFIFGGYDFTANGGTKAEQFVSTPIRLVVTTDPPPRRMPQGTIVTPRPHPTLP